MIKLTHMYFITSSLHILDCLMAVLQVPEQCIVQYNTIQYSVQHYTEYSTHTQYLPYYSIGDLWAVSVSELVLPLHSSCSGEESVHASIQINRFRWKL